MSTAASLMHEPAPIVACTISRDVQHFDLLIDDMELELGESWGDLSFQDAQTYLLQPDANSLEFVAIAVNAQDEPALAEIGQVIKLAKQRGVAVILIADQVGPALLHGLMRLGADDFLPYPLPDGALREAMAKLKAKPAAAPAPQPAPVLHLAPAMAVKPAPAPQPAPVAAAPVAEEPEPVSPPAPTFKAKGDRDGVVLPVHGLAGGSGASTFAVNLAWELATISKTDAPRVCLLDFDFQYGAVATYLDLPRKETVFELLSDVGSADSDTFLAAMLTYGDKLHVLTAPSDMLPLDIVGPDEIARIIEMARSNFDFVVIDMPKTIVAWTETVLSQAHIYFTTIDLDLRSAQNILRLVRALKAEALPHEKLRFVLNRAPKFTDLAAKGRVKRMAESLDITIEVQIPDGGAQVTQANDHGHALAESAPKNPARKELQKLAKSLHDLNKQVEAGRG